MRKRGFSAPDCRAGVLRRSCVGQVVGQSLAELLYSGLGTGDVLSE